MRSAVWVSLVLSAALVVLVGYPWGDMQGHTHWDKVGWIPFVSWPVRPRDIAANLLLCAPLGATCGWGFKRGPWVAGLTALALSLFVESAQLYSHSRFPSATDLVCNVSGAILASVMAGRLKTAAIISHRPA